MSNAFIKGAQHAARLAADDPDAAAAAAVALERWRRTGELVVTDGLLEGRIAPAIEQTRTDIEDVVLFGFKDRLRLQMTLVVHGEAVEVLCSVTPIGCSWGSDSLLQFEFDVVRWHFAGSTSKLAREGLKQTISALIPFGGIVNALGTLAVDHAVKKIGISRLSGWDALTDRGVTIDGNRATVDLRAQPELAGLWSGPPQESPQLPSVDSPSIKAGLARVAGAVGFPQQAADLFAIRGLRADREGLHLHAEMSPHGKKLFEATAGAAGAVQARFAHLLTGPSDAEERG